MATTYDEITDPELLQPNMAVKNQHNVKFPSCRVVLSVMAFLGFFNVYALRVNLSVALVAMVNSTQDHSMNNGTDIDECPASNDTKPSPMLNNGEFLWGPNLQGLVLGSFFYGYITTQIPGGWLAERFGGKILFGGGVLCTSVLTLLTPLAAYWSVYALIVVRILEGIGEVSLVTRDIIMPSIESGSQGVTFPAMHAILAQWAPPLERSKLGTFIYSGAQFGTVVSLPVSGILCQHASAGGWPSVFYIFGSLGCVWFIVWMVLVYDSPAKHPRISVNEREYLDAVIGKQGYKPVVPWRSVFTSPPFIATAVAHFCNNWGYYTLLTSLPTYMKEVLHFDISQNGMLSAIPYIASWLLMMLGGQVADFLRKRGTFSTTVVRKMFNSIGMIGPALFLIITGYVGCDRYIAVAMVAIANGLGGFTMSGYGVNHLDLAPPFAGTLMGITNALATIPGFLGPQVVGAITSRQSSTGNIGQWQIVFYISAGIYLLGALMFAVFASGETQDWGRTDYLSLTTEDDEEE